MSIRAQLIGGLVAGALAFGAGWMANGWRMDAKLARQEWAHATVLEQMAQATVASIEAARNEEARRTAAVEEQRDIAQAKLDGLSLDIAAGAAVSNRLRLELDALRGRGCTCGPAAADGGASKSGTDAIGLLIDVLTGLESAGREVAEYADRLEIAGLACEGSYNSVRDGGVTTGE